MTLEQLDRAKVKFDEKGLVPAIVQDEATEEILMVAWMNEESLSRTLDQGTTWFWSRSRQEFWNKGATSGNMQHVSQVLVHCDADVLVVKVKADSPACHTGERTCFYRTLG